MSHKLCDKLKPRGGTRARADATALAALPAANKLLLISGTDHVPCSHRSELLKIGDAQVGARKPQFVELLHTQPESQPDAASQKSLPIAQGGGAEPCASQLSISEAF